MKKTTVLFIALMFAGAISKAQTTAMNFNMNDCNGQMHNLFSELDQNNVVILEFFMTSCSPCIVAGNKIEAMVDDLNAEFAGHALYYHFGYTNSYSCATVSNWVNTNGFNSVPFDSGAAQVAYYGGFGMPTVVVVAGNQHDVLFSTVGFTTSDTTLMGIAIRNYFSSNPVGISELPELVSSFSIYPNPVKDDAVVKLNLNEKSVVTLQVTDVSGKLVDEIYKGTVQAGLFETKFNTNAVMQGMYILKATVNDKAIYSKFNVVR